MAVATDPQYLAFERQYNAVEGEARAQAANKRSALQRAMARQMPVLDLEQERGMRSVGDDFAARGVFSSGVRVQRQDEVARDTQMKKGLLTAQTADAQADVDGSLAREVAELRRRQAESALQAQQSAALSPMRAVLSSLGG